MGSDEFTITCFWTLLTRVKSSIHRLLFENTTSLTSAQRIDIATEVYSFFDSAGYRGAI